MDANQKLIKLSTTISVSMAMILIIIKFIAWYMTGAVTLLSSLMDSSMDLIVSAINFWAIRYSFKPADHDHRFGHAKAQDLASLAQAVFITVVSTLIAIEAVGKFLKPEVIQSSTIGIIVMSVSLVLTIGLVTFQKYVVRKTSSNLVNADATHYLTDVLSNGSIIIVLFVSGYYAVTWLDPLLGLLLAVYVFTSAFGIGKQAFDNLMDKAFDDAERDQIISIIKSHPQVRGLTDLKTRRSGHKAFIQFEFSMSGEATLNEAHTVAHELETNLLEKFPNAEIFIHEEPEGK